MKNQEPRQTHGSQRPHTKTMSIIADCKREDNLLGEIIFYDHQPALCPHCQKQMRVEKWRRRILIEEGGKRHWTRIRQMFCSDCHRYHNENPPWLCAYKHYEVEVIEGVVDGVLTDETLENIDHPCEQTRKRWKQWIEHNRTAIECQLRTIGYQALNLGLAFLLALESVLDGLRKELRARSLSWLGFVNRVIYNSGSSLEPWPPAYGGPAP